VKGRSKIHAVSLESWEPRDQLIEMGPLTSGRSAWLAGRSPERTLVFSNLLNVDQDNRASDLLATRVLSIDVPSTRDGANVRVHDTIPVNDDGKR
jgi:hypothetical protein